MDSNKYKDLPIVSKILSGNASPSEKQEFENWLALNRNNKQEFERFKKIWNSAHHKHEYDLEAAHQKIKQKIAASEKPTRQIYDTLRRVAAILILPLAFSVLYWGYNTYKASDLQQIELTTITCPLGEIRQLDLPDGTTVYLNAGSKISYPQNFGNTENREVKLIGEALFEVTKDKEKPFIVDLGNVHIKVLGTVFNVSNYIDDSDLEVFLAEGSVELISYDKAHLPTNKMRMIPDQLATLTTTGQLLKLEMADFEDYGSWKDGYLVFNDEPLEEVVRKLKRKFDVEISTPQQIDKGSKINGNFANKSIIEILDILKYTSSISYTISVAPKNEKMHITLSID
ncbi:FecR family protein [Mariniphaga sediminis]|uniref:FecR family protein n=1 Tax=Mariniphaga sediminis TaxID=1628158 RepID=UPI00356924CD